MDGKRRDLNSDPVDPRTTGDRREAVSLAEELAREYGAFRPGSRTATNGNGSSHGPGENAREWDTMIGAVAEWLAEEPVQSDAARVEAADRELKRIFNQRRGASAAVRRNAQPAAGASARPERRARIASRGRQLAWIALPVVVLLVAAFLHLRPQQEIGEILFTRGDVELRSGGGVRAVRESDEVRLAAGHEIRSGLGSAVFQLGPGVTVAADHSTFARIASERRLTLDAGAVWLWVRPGGEGFRVSTALGEVRVLGTSFGVTRREGSLVIDVEEGRVSVSPSSGSAVYLNAGESLTIGKSDPARPPEGDEAVLPAPWVRELMIAGHLDPTSAWLPSFSELP